MDYLEFLMSFLAIMCSWLLWQVAFKGAKKWTGYAPVALDLGVALGNRVMPSGNRLPGQSPRISLDQRKRNSERVLRRPYNCPVS